MKPARASIVLPVHNQADHVEGIIEEYQRSLANCSFSYEFVIVVNASTDASEAKVAAMSMGDERIRLFVEYQGGWGRAVRRGLKEATGDIICYTNSARTSGADLVLVLMYAFANVDVVIKANRKIRESWQRRLGSLLYNLECRMLFDLSYWDINGTPKAFPRSFAALKQLSRDDDLIDLEFNVVCRNNDLRVIEVPIFSSRRHGGSSTTNYASAWRMYKGAYDMFRSNRAL